MKKLFITIVFLFLAGCIYAKELNSVLGVKFGDSCKTADKILISQGFTKVESEEPYDNNYPLFSSEVYCNHFNSSLTYESLPIFCVFICFFKDQVFRIYIHLEDPKLEKLQVETVKDKIIHTYNLKYFDAKEFDLPDIYIEKSSYYKSKYKEFEFLINSSYNPKLSDTYSFIFTDIKRENQWLEYKESIDSKIEAPHS